MHFKRDLRNSQSELKSSGNWSVLSAREYGIDAHRSAAGRNGSHWAATGRTVTYRVTETQLAAKYTLFNIIRNQTVDYLPSAGNG